MRSYIRTIEYKYDRCTCLFTLFVEDFERFLCCFNKTIIPLAVVGYETVIAISPLSASLTIHRLIIQRALVE